jgi:L-ectoine synthase
MYYTSVDSIIGTEREAVGEGWKSRRLLLARDGLPFSVHETTVVAGTELRLRYRVHSETVYVIEGRGSIEIVADDERRPLVPGVLYSARIGDEHILRTETDVRFLCVFEPALEGQEEAD